MLNLEHLLRLWQRFPASRDTRVQDFTLGHRHFDFNDRPSIMGVINLSPDSWYRESVCLSTEQAVQRGRVLHAQGADVVDIGAESTLAHAERVDAEQQGARMLPVIEALSREGILVSAETYHPALAERCLLAGAKVLNLTGPNHAREIYELAGAHDAGVIICHVQGANVREVADLQVGPDPIDTMSQFFTQQLQVASKCGLRKLLIDPGLGFYYRNLPDSAARVRFQGQIFLQTYRLRALGFPVCHALPHAFEFFGEEVRGAEPFFAVLAALGQTDLFRTHEVARVKAVLDTLAAFDDPEPDISS